MKLGRWYNIAYKLANNEETNYWLLPLKDDPTYVTVIKTTTSGISETAGVLARTFTSSFINEYGRLKKKPEYVRVDYKTARNAMKAIFKPS